MGTNEHSELEERLHSVVFDAMTELLSGDEATGRSNGQEGHDEKTDNGTRSQ
jgi:hypothetical protein